MDITYSSREGHVTRTDPEQDAEAFTHATLTDELMFLPFSHHHVGSHIKAVAGDIASVLMAGVVGVTLVFVSSRG